jgi:hypothetical protein
LTEPQTADVVEKDSAGEEGSLVARTQSVGRPHLHLLHNFAGDPPRITPLYVEHDWTVSAAVWRFGIEELSGPEAGESDITIWAGTWIHFGPTEIRTTFSAYEVLGLAALVVAFLVAAVSGAVARYGLLRGGA